MDRNQATAKNIDILKTRGNNLKTFAYLFFKIAIRFHPSHPQPKILTLRTTYKHTGTKLALTVLQITPYFFHRDVNWTLSTHNFTCRLQEQHLKMHTYAHFKWPDILKFWVLNWLFGVMLIDCDYVRFLRRRSCVISTDIKIHFKYTT